MDTGTLYDLARAIKALGVPVTVWAAIAMFPMAMAAYALISVKRTLDRVAALLALMIRGMERAGMMAKVSDDELMAAILGRRANAGD